MLHIPTSLPPEWGVGAVFLSVLVVQLGVPIPAAPMLIVGGTMIAAGEASFPRMLAAAMIATLMADSLWFATGRAHGRKMLNRLVRFSLSLDAAVRIARGRFERFGAPLLAVSKFVPGLGLVAPPLMGTTSVDVRLFLFWDGVGAALWASFWLLGGAALRDQIARFFVFARHNGGTVTDALLVLAGVFLLYRWLRRLRFRQWLARVGITPDQLDGMMRSASPPVIFDARPEVIRRAEAYRIPGALPLDLTSSSKLDDALLERPMVVYCVCPNEATAKRIVSQLRRKGIHHIRALRGGLDAWEKRGFPLEPIPAGSATEDPPAFPRFFAGDPLIADDYTVRATTAK
ncbi:VTT domain-containing protein [Robbsia sp. Bb-Pol-6]|uniref:VTT domain-containing protein n=1 Tax=Robbsia betulipollinis TaxID=2981849 RepID=A0ABT3ZJS8_9BURK|nr:VTT domain-containing protein [Robbsia betulipollinis]MCY0386535.1 VTT domain-containing protein [Robbsia betulipollinis]